MSENYISDQALLAALQDRNEAAISQLYYANWPMILQMVKMNSGNLEEAKDLYQESILDFLEKVWNGNLTLTCKIKSYIYSICRNKWLYQLRGRAKFIDIEDYIELDKELEDTMENEMILPDDDQIMEAINMLGEPCRSLLIGFYYENLSMDQLASKLKYRSVYIS